jgi:hypothetical protein
MLRGEPLMENVLVVDNGTSSSSGGAGLFVDASDVVLMNASIGWNTTAGPGGGVLATGASPTVVNVLVTMNEGGGFECVADCEPLFYHSIFWENTPEDVEGIDEPFGSYGNDRLPASFLAAPSAETGFDVHLAIGSALIDAGDPLLFDPDGSRSDVGVYGGPGASGWDRDGDGFSEYWQPGGYGSAYRELGWDCDDADATVFPGAGC